MSRQRLSALAWLVVPQVLLWTAVFAFATTLDTEVARRFSPIFFTPVSAAFWVGTWVFLEKKSKPQARPTRKQ